VYAAAPEDRRLPPLRRLLIAAVAIVALAAAASWIAQRGPRKFGPEPVELASVERATPTAQPPHAVQPRRGAGTVGARAGSLGAVAAPGEYKSRASQNGDVEIPRFGRAPRPSPVPQGGSISTDAQPGEIAEIAWAGSGVEVIPPPTPGRDPRDGESAGESDAPPDPTVFAPGLLPDPPATRDDTPAPRAESPSRETPSDSGEPVTADGPLTPEQIDRIVDEKLAGLPPEQREPLTEPTRQEVADNANQACGWTRCQP
jgi:hypothetical protein